MVARTREPQNKMLTSYNLHKKKKLKKKRLALKYEIMEIFQQKHTTNYRSYILWA